MAEYDNETILCLWENIYTSKDEGIRNWINRVGLAEARLSVANDLDITQACNAGWDLVRETRGLDCFDLDYVPWFIDHCLDFEHGLTLKPDYAKAFHA